MKRTYFLLLFILAAVTAAKAQTAIQMNDKLASITDSLYSGGQRWGAQFNKSFASGNYTPLKPITDELLGYINVKTAEVQKMKDVKNSKPLRVVMLEFLVFEKKMISEGFRPFEVFDATTTKEKVQAALDNLTQKSNDENTYLKKVAAAQETYAKENGFKIAGQQ